MTPIRYWLIVDDIILVANDIRAIEMQMLFNACKNIGLA